MSRKMFVGANMKMNPIPLDLSAYQSTDTCDVVVFPTVLDIQVAIDAKLATGAQGGLAEDTGAHTGDLSMSMLKAKGITHILCGHSERRTHHGESNEDVADMVGKALELDLVPVLCIGETAEENDKGETNAVLEKQIKAVADRCSLIADRCVIAYEPVWAIGTGKTPTTEDIQKTHAFIRSLLPDQGICILYGGSVKPENAAEIFGCEDVDGGLIGGASLHPDGFKRIVEAAN